MYFFKDFWREFLTHSFLLIRKTRIKKEAKALANIFTTGYGNKIKQIKVFHNGMTQSIFSETRKIWLNAKIDVILRIVYLYTNSWTNSKYEPYMLIPRECSRIRDCTGHLHFQVIWLYFDKYKLQNKLYTIFRLHIGPIQLIGIRALATEYDSSKLLHKEYSMIRVLEYSLLLHNQANDSDANFYFMCIAKWACFWKGLRVRVSHVYLIYSLA